MKLMKSLLLTSLLATSITFPTNALAVKPIQVFIDKQKIDFVVAPVIQDGTTLVQFRTIFEKLGYSVEWNQEKRSVTASKRDLSIELYIDSRKAYVNSKEVLLEKAPTVINGGTMVPLRFVSETSGKKVNWKAETRTIEIGDTVTLPNEPTSSNNTTTKTEIPSKFKKLPVTIEKPNYTVTVDSIKRIVSKNDKDPKTLITVTLTRGKNNNYPIALNIVSEAWGNVDVKGENYYIIDTPSSNSGGIDKETGRRTGQVSNFFTENTKTIEIPCLGEIEDGTKTIRFRLNVSIDTSKTTDAERKRIWDLEDKDSNLTFDIDTTDLFE